jgi:hypothetical protein
VSAEPAALKSLQRRGLEEVPVPRVPDRLHHVPEVEPAGLELDVVHNRRKDEQRGVRDRSGVHDTQGRVSVPETRAYALTDERGPVGRA